jgi:hypothetical protein
MERLLGDHVDFAMEQPSELKLEAYGIVTARCRRYQEIHVAGESGFSSSYRAEHPHFSSPIPLGKPDDVCTSVPEHGIDSKDTAIGRNPQPRGREEGRLASSTDANTNPPREPVVPATVTVGGRATGHHQRAYVPGHL